MTPSQQKELERIRLEWSETDYSDYDDFVVPAINQLLSIIDSLQTELDDKWISIKDKQPELNESVWATDGKIMWINHTYEVDYATYWIIDSYTVTHWQPLPKPPKEKDKQ